MHRSHPVALAATGVLGAVLQVHTPSAELHTSLSQASNRAPTQWYERLSLTDTPAPGSCADCSWGAQGLGMAAPPPASHTAPRLSTTRPPEGPHTAEGRWGDSIQSMGRSKVGSGRWGHTQQFSKSCSCCQRQLCGAVRQWCTPCQGWHQPALPRRPSALLAPRRRACHTACRAYYSERCPAAGAGGGGEPALAASAASPGRPLVKWQLQCTHF